MTPEQIAFVQTQLAGGKTEQEVRELLAAHQYTPESIDALIAAVKGRDAVPGATVAAPQTLPRFMEFAGLVKKRLLDRPHWILIAVGVSVASGLIVSAFEAGGEYGTNLGLLTLPLALGFLAVSCFYGVYLTKNLLNPVPAQSRADVEWTLKNFWSVLWVGILCGLVMLSSFMLFIIPGIIVTTYILLAQPVRVAEGVRGIDALVRSTQLVRGYFWGVFGRLLGVIVPVALVLGAVSGIISGTMDAGPTVIALLQSVTNGLIGLVVAVLVIELYTSLAAIQPAFDQTKPTKVRTLYKTAAWSSPLFLIVGIIIAMAVAVAFFSGLSI